jgi:uncharacterized OB-fold protein
MPDFTTPVPDRDSAPYWAALAEGRVEVQQCQDCSRWSWPPRPICSNCQSENLEWKPVRGTGEVYSWVIAHRPFVPRLADQVPYTIALVRLDDDPDVLVLGRLLSGDGVHQGMRVRAVAEKLTDDVGDLTWDPVTAEA